jgi:four helix bundle protein
VTVSVAVSVAVSVGFPFAVDWRMLEKFEVFQIAKKFHWACKDLKIQRFLTDQLGRASASIALNIAEGSGKRTAQDQARYYSIALGSLRECQAILELERVDDPDLRAVADRLGAMLYKLSCKKPTFGPQTETATKTETAAETVTERKTDPGLTKRR